MSLLLLNGSVIMNNDEIKIHLNDFDGPLELLLHLIKQSKMDIYDINIKDITSQYVNLLNKMKKLSIDIAGEFFVMAANLMKIKSQMLLAEETEQETEEDPREDLVAQLIEYKKYKRAALVLKQKERERNHLHSRGIYINRNEISIEEDEFQISLLKNAWEKLIRRKAITQDAPVGKINEWNYEIPNQMELIENKLKDSLKHEIKFCDLLKSNAPLEELVTDFLALLTLIKQKRVWIMQVKIDDDIIIKGV
ncbi:segregation/condensation protein A [Lactobacillus sanfranciscensis]|nr:segregation/condensation protein A [Fructilactobacillus sanfranciscensis]NDS16238.1 segregation/condensation protein A [Fructilactobacillus sanfranciscensis]